ncbi:MAG: thiamine phosphate synthase [Gemmatimonadetes bacterium]|nr:thiamine phosphate synthase [Gemmatimonadota bacterium]
MKSVPPFRLLFIGSLALSGEDRFLPTLEAAVRGGADAFLLREKALEGRALWKIATAARAITRSHGAKLIVSDRFDVALAAGADGVHLPESGFDPRDIRDRVGGRLLIGRSVHDAGGARTAEEAGADYLMLGPLFATPGKKPLEPEAAGNIVRERSIPVAAVGGIEPERIPALAALGFRSFAVIRAIAGSAGRSDAAPLPSSLTAAESAARALAKEIARAVREEDTP